ncbi:MAG: hypothetical protein KGV44_01385 [Flavobacteriaceae bacterium]|nr:hypothetical protein [Flavobacteriaceae bacterium]
MTKSQELVQKWDNFLLNIENRFFQTLEQAEEASVDLLKESDYDYGKTIQAFAGMKGQIENLIQKIDTTWDNKVRPKMELTFGNSDWVDESKKGSNLSAKLWDKLQEFEIILEGKISQLFYNHTIAIADENFHCSQCNAKLQIVKTLFRSQYITCDYCDTVNTFQPETKFKELGWGIVDNIVKLNLLEEQKALHKHYSNLKELEQIGKATQEDFENYKTKYLAYWERFFKERIQLNSDCEKRFNEDMQRKLKELNS